MIPYTFHPEAEAEFDAAAVIYEAQSTGLSVTFIAAIERAIQFIRTYPEAGAPVALPIRRALVRGFPYAIIYRVDPDTMRD